MINLFTHINTIRRPYQPRLSVILGKHLFITYNNELIKCIKLLKHYYLLDQTINLKNLLTLIQFYKLYKLKDIKLNFAYLYDNYVVNKLI